MLNLYIGEENVPKGMKIVKINDPYFIIKVGKIRDTAINRKLIEVVEKGKYYNEKYFIGRFSDGIIDCSFLSTGAKTILNMLEFRDKCFDTIECGNNVIQFLFDYVNEGNVLLHTGNIGFIKGEKECMLNNIIIRNDAEFGRVYDEILHH